MRMVLATPAFVALCVAALIGPPAPPSEAAANRDIVGYQVVYSFQGGRDGRSPQAGLVDDGGLLYGTTFGGGSANAGTVFAVSPSTGAEQVVHAFASGRHDGQLPVAGLAEARGALWGTTYSGGAANNGAVFSVQPVGSERIVYGFPIAAKGANPAAGLLNVNGVLYGTTSVGGTSGKGTVFAIDKSGHYRVVHNFAGPPDGANPSANLINVGGTLYGSTSDGGTVCHESPQGCGVVFSISPSGSETVVYRFLGGVDGVFPSALLNAGSALVGTTQRGGHGEEGTVFAISTAGVKITMYYFGSPPDGALPAGGLIEVGGTFYGTTQVGGGYGGGSVFSVSPSGAETILHSFGGAADGSGPGAALLDVAGTLYGTTQFGGTNACGCGSVFALTP